MSDNGSDSFSGDLAWDFEPLIVTDREATPPPAALPTPATPLKDVPIEILKLIVQPFILSDRLDYGTLFPTPTLNANTSYDARVKTRTLLSLCGLNHAWAAAAQPELWKYVYKTPLSIFSHSREKGSLVKALRLDLRIDEKTDLDSLALADSLRQLSNVEWLDINLVVSRTDTLKLASDLKEAISCLATLRYIRLQARLRVLDVGPRPFASFNVLPSLSILPDRFEGHLHSLGPSEGALPKGLKALSVLASRAFQLALQRGELADLQTLRVAGDCGALLPEMQLQALSLANLTRLWLDTWSGSDYHPAAGLWLSLSGCINLHTIACSFRSNGLSNIDLVSHLPRSLKHLYMLDFDPSAVAHLSGFPMDSLETLVIYIAEAHQWQYRRRYDWTVAAADAELLVERVRSSGVAFWPGRFCAYVQDMEWGQDRDEWNVPAEEQEASFMAGRLPKVFPRS